MISIFKEELMLDRNFLFWISMYAVWWMIFDKSFGSVEMYLEL